MKIELEREGSEKMLEWNWGHNSIGTADCTYSQGSACQSL